MAKRNLTEFKQKHHDIMMISGNMTYLKSVTSFYRDAVKLFGNWDDNYNTIYQCIRDFRSKNRARDNVIKESVVQFKTKEVVVKLKTKQNKPKKTTPPPEDNSFSSPPLENNTPPPPPINMIGNKVVFSSEIGAAQKESIMDMLAHLRDEAKTSIKENKQELLNMKAETLSRLGDLQTQCTPLHNLLEIITKQTEELKGYKTPDVEMTAMLAQSANSVITAICKLEKMAYARISLVADLGVKHKNELKATIGAFLAVNHLVGEVGRNEVAFLQHGMMKKESAKNKSQDERFIRVQDIVRTGVYAVQKSDHSFIQTTTEPLDINESSISRIPEKTQEDDNNINNCLYGKQGE